VQASIDLERRDGEFGAALSARMARWSCAACHQCTSGTVRHAQLWRRPLDRVDGT